MGKEIVLLTSLDPDVISGGNIYNKKLINGFDELGIKNAIVFSENPLDVLQNLAANTRYLVDSIVLNEAVDWKRIDPKKIYILLHMCPSQEKGKSTKELRAREEYVFSNFPVFSAGSASITYIKSSYEIKDIDHLIVQPGIDDDWKRKLDYNIIKPLKFVCLSNIAKEKGIIRAIKTFNFLDNDASLDIYGAYQDVPFLNEVKNVIKSLDLNSRVKLKGACKHSEVNDLLLQYDILFHLSDHENNALAIRESIATGLPFVTTPTGDYQAFLKDNIGIVTSNFIPFDIANKVKEQLYDSINYKELISKSKLANTSTWTSMAKKFVSKMNIS